nr:uncharacterized mitochondrial protein AtMg00810-like [Tanacetum cinerariifolium]
LLNGIIELYFIRTEYQLADMFTKALPKDKFKYLVRRIGLQIHQSPRGIFINQAKYTLEILHKHGMDKGQSIGTPMGTKPKLDADLSGNLVDQTDYHSKIGSLMYLTSSRPDIVQAMLITPDALILAKALLENSIPSQNQRDLPKDTSIDRLEFLRYDFGKRSKVRIGIIPTKTELTLEQSQQVTMEILLEPTSNKLLVGDVRDSLWIELVTLDINLGPE